MTTGFIQARSMDIFFLFFLSSGPNKRIRGLCGPPACRMMRVGGESNPLTPPPAWTPPKEHQSQHCCGTVGSFELSVREEGAQRWMAHRMKPPFSQPCGNALPGLNNYSGPAQLRQNLQTRDKRGKTESRGEDSVKLRIMRVDLELNRFPGKRTLISYEIWPVSRKIILLGSGDWLWKDWAKHPPCVLHLHPHPLLLIFHFSQLIVARRCQAHHGVSTVLRSGAATLPDGGKYFAGAFLRRTSHWGSTAAHNYLLFGWRRSGRGYGG